MSSPARSAPNLACPHCHSTSVRKYGFFRLKNGERQQRFLCCACSRTFNPLTATPLQYLKKRDRWPSFLHGIVNGLSVRLSAALLEVHPSTAFRWRHLLLSTLRCCPQPVLSGLVAVGETLVPYSEKGGRTGHGPGAYGRRKPGYDSRRFGHQYSDGRRYRHLVDGKPILVLLLSNGSQHAVVRVGRSRIGFEQLYQTLAQRVQAGSTVAAQGLAPYEEVCMRLQLQLRPWFPTAQGLPQLPLEVRRATGELRSWLKRFRGVATRYLENYLAWYRMVRILARNAPRLAYAFLVAESHARQVAERPLSGSPSQVA